MKIDEFIFYLKSIVKSNNGKRLMLHCPLGSHEDKKPSFNFDLEGYGYNCFSCGEHGHVFELAERMGKKIGQDKNRAYVKKEIARYKARKESQEKKVKYKPSFFSWSQTLQQIYPKHCMVKIQDITGKYKEVPDLSPTEDFIKYCLTRGILSSCAYENFRIFMNDKNQIVFPWIYGEKIAGCQLQNFDKNRPKYQFTPGFKVSEFLYNANDIRDYDVIIVVEGAWDAVAVRQYIEEYNRVPVDKLFDKNYVYPEIVIGVVSAGSCHMTPAQAKQLRDKTVLLMFDADEAGMKGMERARKLLEPYALKVCCVQLMVFEPGIDPNELYIKGGFPRLFELLQKIIPITGAPD